MNITYFYKIIVLLLLSLLLNSTTYAAKYEYDDLNRLVRVAYNSGQFIEYDYDNAGNILSIDTNEIPEPPLDTDEDGIPDETDLDDDNDGMPDEYENQYDFLNPLDASDALADQDDDGFTNLEEYQNGTNPNVPGEPPTPGGVTESDKDNFNLNKAGFGIAKVKPKGQTNWSIDCKADCDQESYDFPLETKLLLTASPRTGYEFTSWQCDNGLMGSESRWSFTLNQPTTCTLTFAAIQEDPKFSTFTGKLVGTGSSGGSISVGNINLKDEGKLTLPIDKTVWLKAKPTTPYSSFKVWSGDCSGDKSGFKLLMEGDKTCYAEFEDNSELIGQEMVEQLYQSDTFASQYPQAENETCLQEAMSFAATWTHVIESHLHTMGTWPTQLNNIELYSPPPINTDCTQSLKMLDNAQSNYLQIQVWLSNANSQTESVNLQASLKENSSDIDWVWRW